MHAYEIVAEKNFLYLMYVLEQKFHVPFPDTFATTIVPTMYERVRELLQHEIAAADTVSVTSDMCRSKARNSYISLTVTYDAAHIHVKASTCTIVHVH